MICVLCLVPVLPLEQTKLWEFFPLSIMYELKLVKQKFHNKNQTLIKENWRSSFYHKSSFFFAHREFIVFRYNYAERLNHIFCHNSH